MKIPNINSILIYFLLLSNRENRPLGISYALRERKIIDSNDILFSSYCYHLKSIRWLHFRFALRLRALAIRFFGNFRWRTVGIDLTFIARGSKFNGGSGWNIFTERELYRLRAPSITILLVRRTKGNREILEEREVHFFVHHALPYDTNSDIIAIITIY